MSMRRKLMLGLLAAALLGLLLLAAIPAAIPVSASQVKRGYFAELVEDEGRTRLRDPYTISAPITGFLRRVVLEPGDAVAAGDVVFEMEALPAPALDARAREQARESVAAARARLEAAEAELESRRTQAQLAETEFERAEQLRQRDLIAVEERDRRRAQRDASRIAERAAQHAVEVARFELEATRALLQITDGERAPGDQPSLGVRTPIAGTVTKRHRCCEGPAQSGEPILEVGDLAAMEIQVDLLSMDAVRVRPGMRVLLERWGGEASLQGTVRRVEPAGFMRISALGVDEQRVPVLINIDSPREHWLNLGDGFRVEARFIIWEAEDVLQAPTSALFRQDENWMLFVVANGRARLRTVTPGRRSGLQTQILSGLDAGEWVITHPSDRITHGSRVRVDQ